MTHDQQVTAILILLQFWVLIAVHRWIWPKRPLLVAILFAAAFIAALALIGHSVSEFLLGMLRG